ncbi:MAG: UDP-N-acetylmuramate dehydrogenase [Candidatus Dojkabacteria bacterium]|nr:MAG: UDP-N-acetylmuramate dehydrogenase [Candidatus Dojkabacteria bacterium]
MSLQISENYSLKELNTMKVEAKAKYYVEVTNIEELKTLIKSDIFKTNDHVFLGKGTSTLFLGDYDGLVIKNLLYGMNIQQDGDEILVQSWAGEDWQDMVNYAVTEGYGGIENLAHIPGSVGAAPIQNISAYGEHLSDVFERLTALDVETGEERIFLKDECDFGYRSSCFRNELAGKYFVVSVTVRLTNNHKVNLRNPFLKEKAEEMGYKNPTLQDIPNIIKRIYDDEFPELGKIGTSGFFFMSPYIPKELYDKLAKKYELKALNEQNGEIQVPASQLIRLAGLDNERSGDVGIYAKSPAIVVNYGKASGKDVYSFAKKIAENVEKKFGITLDTGVSIYGK